MQYGFREAEIVKIHLKSNVVGNAQLRNGLIARTQSRSVALLLKFGWLLYGPCD